MAKSEKKPPVRIASVAKAGPRSQSGGKNAGKNGDNNKEQPLPVVTLGKSDFLNGSAKPGHHLQLGDSVFELSATNTILLISSEGALAEHCSLHREIFVTTGQILNNEFASPLSNGRRAKQMAMWQHTREVLGEDGLKRLQEMRATRAAFLDGPAKLRDMAVTAAVEAATQTTFYVDENFANWERAGSTSPEEALTKLDEANFIEIRLGKSSEEGIVLGFIFRNGHGSSIHIEAGHIGTKHPLHQLIIKGTFLNCHRGNFREAIPAVLVEMGGRVASAQALLSFLIGLPHSEKDPIMTAMNAACKRIHNKLRDEVPRNPDSNVVQINRQTTATQPDDNKSSKAVLTQGTALLPTPETVVEPTTNTDLISYISTLRQAGFDGAILANMVAAYHESNPSAKVAANQ